LPVASAAVGVPLPLRTVYEKERGKGRRGMGLGRPFFCAAD